jgi:hypothetical protein
MPFDGMKGLGDDAKGGGRKKGLARRCRWGRGGQRGRGLVARGSRRAAEGTEVAGRRGSRGSRKTTSWGGGRLFESNSSHGPKERFDVVATS